MYKSFKEMPIWHEAMEVVGQISHRSEKFPRKEDYGVTSQIRRSALSIFANIAEGYSRRTINEYLQFLNIALGSCGELITRLLGLKEIGILSELDFEEIDMLHCAVENKSIGLVKSLQAKRRQGGWFEEFGIESARND
jgi:S23 ribosomal protein.